MRGTFIRASRRTVWLCLLSSVLMLIPQLIRAEDPFDDTDLPAPDPIVPNSTTNYDGDSTSSGRLSMEEAEMEAAKLRVRNQPLSRINASIQPPAGATPEKRNADNRASQLAPQHSLDDLAIANGMFLLGHGRPWGCNSFEWEAPATKHLPLLFEEPNLERLGYTYGVCDVGICDEDPLRGQRLQILASGAHFFGRVPFLPYMAGVRPLTEPVYTLGADRPGSPVPFRRYLPHWSLKGAIYQAGATVGAVYIIP